jgi:folate-binding protein YgfZ
VAGHYGDPYREQRELEAGRGAVDLSHRPVVRITGPDRLSWLHSLLSQHVAALQPGQSTEALVLSPNGHVEHHLQLVETGEEVLAHVEPGTAGELVAFLDRMRFMLRVEVSLADDLAVVWEPAGEGGPTRTETGFGRHLLVPRTEVAAYTVTAGVQAYEALRVAARRPRLGLDTDHRTLPHEVGWLTSAVHLDKGCYRGQETVARVHNLGRPPRRLALLHLDDADLPLAGSPVTLGEREVGRVGSAVRHHELGPIGLALLKRTVPDDTELRAGGVAARVDPAPIQDVPESPARAAAAARAGLLRF